MDGGAWWAAVHGVARSQTRLSDFTFTHWRRKWQPTPVFLPGESQGRGEPGGLPSMGSHPEDLPKPGFEPSSPVLFSFSFASFWSLPY